MLRYLYINSKLCQFYVNENSLGTIRSEGSVIPLFREIFEEASFEAFENWTKKTKEHICHRFKNHHANNFFCVTVFLRVLKSFSELLFIFLEEMSPIKIETLQ